MEGTSTPSDATPTSSQNATLPGNSTVLGVFESLDQATEAVTRLGEAGFPMERVSIVGQGLQSELKVHGFVTTGDVAKAGAKWGAVFDRLQTGARRAADKTVDDAVANGDLTKQQANQFKSYVSSRPICSMRSHGGGSGSSSPSPTGGSPSPTVARQIIERVLGMTGSVSSAWLPSTS